MAQIYEPRNPISRSPIINNGIKRMVDEKREGVNILKQQSSKGKAGKPVLRRGEYNG